MEKPNDTIAVTIDKSHLATLGERLYVEAVELFRELVSNAYDADASEVYVRLEKDTIVVEDNGSGMDMRGLKQFFNIRLAREAQALGISASRAQAHRTIRYWKVRCADCRRQLHGRVA